MFMFLVSLAFREWSLYEVCVFVMFTAFHVEELEQ